MRHSYSLATTFFVVLASSNSLFPVEGAWGGNRRNMNIRGVRRLRGADQRMLGKPNKAKMEKLQAPTAEESYDEGLAFVSEDGTATPQQEAGNVETPSDGKGKNGNNKGDKVEEEEHEVAMYSDDMGGESGDIGSQGGKGKNNKDKAKNDKLQVEDDDIDDDEPEASNGGKGQDDQGGYSDEEGSEDIEPEEESKGGKGKDNAKDNAKDDEGGYSDEDIEPEEESKGGKGKDNEKDDEGGYSDEDIEPEEESKGGKGKDNAQDFVGYSDEEGPDDAPEEEYSKGGKGKDDEQEDEGVSDQDYDNEVVSEDNEPEEESKGGKGKEEKEEDEGFSDEDDMVGLEAYADHQGGKGKDVDDGPDEDTSVVSGDENDEPDKGGKDGKGAEEDDDMGFISEDDPPAERPVQAPSAVPQYSEDDTSKYSDDVGKNNKDSKDTGDSYDTGKKDKDDKVPEDDVDMEAEDGKENGKGYSDKDDKDPEDDVAMEAEDGKGNGKGYSDDEDEDEDEPTKESDKGDKGKDKEESSSVGKGDNEDEEDEESDAYSLEEEPAQAPAERPEDGEGGKDDKGGKSVPQYFEDEYSEYSDDVGKNNKDDKDTDDSYGTGKKDKDDKDPEDDVAMEVEDGKGNGKGYSDDEDEDEPTEESGKGDKGKDKEESSSVGKGDNEDEEDEESDAYSFSYSLEEEPAQAPSERPEDGEGGKDDKGGNGENDEGAEDVMDDDADLVSQDDDYIDGGKGKDETFDDPAQEPAVALEDSEDEDAEADGGKNDKGGKDKEGADEVMDDAYSEDETADGDGGKEQGKEDKDKGEKDQDEESEDDVFSMPEEASPDEAEPETDPPTDEAPDTEPPEPELPDTDPPMPVEETDVPETNPPTSEDATDPPATEAPEIAPGEVFSVGLEPFNLTVEGFGATEAEDLQLDSYLLMYMQSFFPNLIDVSLDGKKIGEQDTLQQFYFEGNATFEGPPARPPEDVDDALTIALLDAGALASHLEAIDPTEAPETEPPVPEETDVPEEPEVTDAPETEPPMPEETDAPEEPEGTDLPETSPPTSEATDGERPVATDPPATERPATETPATEAPATDDPVVPPATDPPAESLNDKCESALEVEAGLDYFGSTVDAEFGNIGECGEALGGASAAPGLWYSIVGTGSGFKATVNASYDMQMSVFEGPDCGMRTCIGGTSGEQFPWTSGQISWASEPGILYYIYVYGWEGQVGDFVLVVFEGEIPSNSDCESAIFVEGGDDIEGTTEFSYVPDVDACVGGDDDFFQNVTAPTVWYSMEGTGEIAQISVYSDFDAQLSIYTGESCDSLSCVVTNDDSPIPGPRSIVSEYLNEGQQYYILVHGFGNGAGDFTMVVETLKPAENDECTGAMELKLGISEPGDNFAASKSEGLPFCGPGTNESSIGVWYSAVGTGGVLEATLNQSVMLDFSVYSGESCDSLTCRDYQDRALYPLDWESNEGEQYFIYVYGTGHRKDDFDILVAEVTRPENDQCEDAIPLEVNGRATEGTTSVSSAETGEVCGEVFELGHGGVWYTFTGTGSLTLVGVTAKDMPNGVQFDSQILLYKGSSCEELTCVDGNDQGEDLGYSSALSLISEEGQTYHLLVKGWGESRGDFTVQVKGVDRPDNDECDSSIALEPFDTVAGATFFATQNGESEFEACGTSQGGNFSAPGVWYTVEGTGGSLEASIVATYDVQLTVSSGDCSDLTCVDGTEGYTTDFFSGAVVWDSEVGTDYHLLVHGFSGQVGEFELFFSEVARPPNDDCDSAIELELQDRVAGSNEEASVDEVASCAPNSTQITTAPGVWYSYTTPDPLPESSSGVYALAMTLTNWTFPHQITVLSGDSCDNLVCIGHDGLAVTGGAFVQWLPDAGTTYRFAVQGYGEERGDFELSLLEI